MNGAPSVSYPVGRSRLAAATAAAAWFLGAIAWAAWVALAPGPGWRQWLGLALLALCGALARLEWKWQVPARLAWDGQQWRCEIAGGDESGAATLRMDLQRWLLLQWVPEQGRSRWLWLTRADDPRHWEALRRAVYFRGRNEVPQRGQPPVA